MGILSFLFAGCGKQLTSPDQRLLQLLETELNSCGVEAAAKSTHEDGRLMTYNRRLAIAVTIQERTSNKVHAHITSLLANSAVAGGADMLEACILGFGKTESEAMSEAAKVWLTMVGSPVLSALAARPLLEADHFDGDEPWGIPGGHGFVGPFMTRGQVGGLDLDALAQSSAFQFTGYPRDGRPHLVKVTLLSQKGVWERHLEMDGHSKLVSDEWRGMPAPDSTVLCTRFAIFFMK
jgi:hypothetical protein